MVKVAESDPKNILKQIFILNYAPFVMYGVMDDVTKLFFASFPTYNQHFKHLALSATNS